MPPDTTTASCFNFFPNAQANIKGRHTFGTFARHTRPDTKANLAKEPNFANTLPNSNITFKKKKMKNFFLAFIGLSFLLTSCGGNECKVGKEMSAANGLDENYCPKIDTTIKPLSQPSIKKVNVFFDASGSMAGYMPSTKPSSELQIIIPDIISRLKTQYPNSVTFYPIYNSNSPMKSMNVEAAQDKILYGTITQNTGDTYLPTMLDSVYKSYFSPDAVNIFISDCIYSPNNKEKKQAEQATKEIRETIINYTKDYSTSAFCLHSKYLKVNGSPYYLIVFGKPENNHEIENIVTKSLNDNKQNFEAVNFGLKYNQPFYSVLPYTDKSANCIANPCETYQGAFVNVVVQSWNAQSDSMSFWIGIDLKKYPEYATTQSYLDSNLILTLEKGISRIISITNQPPKGLEKDDKPITDKSTHYIQIRVSQLDDCVTSLHLALRFSKPFWINQLNEEESENNREKTYGLKRMMQGFEQAYNPDGKAYFFNDLKVSLIKQ
jgi:hypothetical protein